MYKILHINFILHHILDILHQPYKAHGLFYIVAGDGVSLYILPNILESRVSGIGLDLSRQTILKLQAAGMHELHRLQGRHRRPETM